MITLIKLTENDKRFLLALVLVFLLIFVIVGYIGLLIERIMKYQAKRASTMMNNVVESGVIKSPGEFQKFGLKKNTRLFFQQSWIPFCILLVAAVIFLIYAATRNFDVNMFDYEKKGITTIMFLWDFDKAPRSKFFDIELISGWPPLKNAPHWEADAWGCYIFCPILLIVGGWYLVLVQAFIARQIKIFTLSKKVFNRSLDNYNPSNPTQNTNNQDAGNQNTQEDEEEIPVKPL